MGFRGWHKTPLDCDSGLQGSLGTVPKLPCTRNLISRLLPAGPFNSPRASLEWLSTVDLRSGSALRVRFSARLLALVGKVHLSKIRSDGHPVLVYLPTIAIHYVLWAWRRQGCTLLGTGVGGTRNWSRSHLKGPVPPRDPLCFLTSKLFHLQNPPSTPSIVSDSARQNQKMSDTDINRRKSDIFV